MTIAMRRPQVRVNTVLVIVAAFMLLVGNLRLWSLLWSVADADPTIRIAQFLAIGALLFVLILILLVPLSFKPLLKPWLAFWLLVSASGAYFLQNYRIGIDKLAVQSVFETDAHELSDWLSLRMLPWLLLYWVLPVALLAWVRVTQGSARREWMSRLKLLLAAGAMLLLCVLFGGKHVASLLRNHREIRYVTNPVSLVSASLSYAAHVNRMRGNAGVLPIATDAHRTGAMAASVRPVVLVLMVGESARASSFSLGGYARDTNPMLSKRPIIYFSDMHSCGTTTTVSLPCMFSRQNRAEYDERTSARRENLLDVLHRAGFDVIWYENNTGSKGLADRVQTIDLSGSADPRFCTFGCVDGLLVDAMRTRLASITHDTVFVLHTKGSHGPAYYYRYPQAEEIFRPACRQNDLSACTREQIVNAYDNSIRYTDRVIASAIDVLQAASQVDGALVYVSDHGESTGEKGLYLHGMPYALAPQEQTRIPMLLWMSDAYRVRRGLDAQCLRSAARKPWSHDNLFDLMLGMGGVQTSVYRQAQDPAATCQLAVQ